MFEEGFLFLLEGLELWSGVCTSLTGLDGGSIALVGCGIFFLADFDAAVFLISGGMFP